MQDRSAIDAASNDVATCGPDLSQDATAFRDAASSRQSLMSQLENLPDAQALPAQLVTDLGDAWQASYQADEDFAAWATDENGGGCNPNTTSDDPNYQAANQPDMEATMYKQAFASAWDPIASQYGLATYTWNQL